MAKQEVLRTYKVCHCPSLESIDKRHPKHNILCQFINGKFHKVI